MADSVQDKLLALHALVNYCIEQEVKPNKGKFIGDAINWGDLKCFDARFVVNMDGNECYEVWIDEASPDCSTLRSFVEDWLLERGHSNVVVMTEW